MPRCRFRADAREAHLAVRIVRIREVHVEGDLAVDADRLDFLDDRRARAFEHADVKLSIVTDR